MYSKGTVLKYKNDHYHRLILAQCGDLFAVSFGWRATTYNDIGGNGLRDDQGCLGWITKDELDACYTIATRKEAGMPAEPWKPNYNDKYWTAWVDFNGDVSTTVCYWHNGDFNKIHLERDNVHKTEAEAIAWGKKRYNV